MLVPLRFTLRDVVEFLFDVCRKVEVDDVGEVFHKEVVHHNADIRGDEFPLFGAGSFGFLGRSDFAVFESNHLVRAPNAGLFAFFDVTAVLYSRNSRSESRRTADAEFFEFFDEHSFGIARRMLRETLVGFARDEVKAFAVAEFWK